jgi:hypothetical protein
MSYDSANENSQQIDFVPTTNDELIVDGYIKRKLCMFLNDDGFEVIVRERDGFVNVSQMVKKYTNKKLGNCLINNKFKEELSELQKICMFIYLF